MTTFNLFRRQTAAIFSYYLLLSLISTSLNSTTALARSISPRNGPAVKFDSCFVRFQNPRPGQTPADARVTITQWEQTPGDVRTTIGDMENSNKQNSPLWLQGLMGILYAGFYSTQSIPMVPQHGLNGPDIVVSLILPSGVSKLRQVGPDTSGMTEDQKRRVSSIFGIALRDSKVPLVPADYAYIQNWSKAVPPSEIHDPADKEGGLKAKFDAWSAEWKNAKTSAQRDKLEKEGFSASAMTGDGKTIVVMFESLIR